MDVLANWGAHAQALAGNGAWGTEPQAVVTDMAPQLSGTAPSGKANGSAPDASKKVLHDAVTLVGVCLVLLWVMGAIAFKTKG